MADLNHFTHFHISADLLNISNTIHKYILSAKPASGGEGAGFAFQLDFLPYTEHAADSEDFSWITLGFVGQVTQKFCHCAGLPSWAPCHFSSHASPVPKLAAALFSPYALPEIHRLSVPA